MRISLSDCIVDVARWLVFSWKNRDKGQEVIEKKVSDVELSSFLNTVNLVRPSPVNQRDQREQQEKIVGDVVSLTQIINSDLTTDSDLVRELSLRRIVTW